MVQDTLKLSGVILLRVSVPNCGSGSEGTGPWVKEKERDIIRGSSGFFQNVAIGHESAKPSKDRTSGCGYTGVDYNPREYTAFSAGMMCVLHKDRHDHLLAMYKEKNKPLERYVGVIQNSKGAVLRFAVGHQLRKMF